MIRNAAVRILSQVHRSRSKFAAERIHGACVDLKLNKRDRRFLHQLVFGVLRHHLTLDRIVAAHSNMALEEIGRKTIEALRIGVYQLLFLDAVPPHAAISESVSALGPDKRARGFVNAVLRSIDRGCRRVRPEQDRGGASPTKRLEIPPHKVCFFSRKVFSDPEENLAAYLAEVYSHPEFLVGRWLERLGPERTEAVLARNNQTPPLFVRRNRLKGSRDEVMQRLQLDGVRCRAGNLPDSIRVEVPATELVRTPCFRGGGCTVQDETAMLAAPILQVSAGQRILDLCAAPGGKTTHLAELSEDRAVLVATDREEARLELLRESVARLQLSSVLVLQHDALGEEPLPGDFSHPYDRVLLDVPCSNTGVLGRRPEARFRIDEGHLAELCRQQSRLLDRALGLLAGGGLLVYSTCSIEEDENAGQIERLLERRPDLECIEQLETLPADDRGDGGFVALLKKTGSGSASS